MEAQEYIIFAQGHGATVEFVKGKDKAHARAREIAAGCIPSSCTWVGVARYDSEQKDENGFYRLHPCKLFCASVYVGSHPWGKKTVDKLKRNWDSFQFLHYTNGSVLPA